MFVLLQGGCKITPVGYGHMTHMLSSLANGRVIIVLEVRKRISLTHCILGNFHAFLSSVDFFQN